MWHNSCVGPAAKWLRESGKRVNPEGLKFMLVSGVQVPFRCSRVKIDNMVPFCSFQALREEKNVIILIGVSLVLFIVSMDIILYTVLQNTVTLAVPDPVKAPSYSMFHPLSMKLLMIDDSSQYFIKPTTEIFEKTTNFSKVFFFITPNMISYFHLILGFIGAKLVASECLRQRRFGLLLYQIKVWLDGLDGVVFRARSGDLAYRSHRDTWGYYVDSICDTTGGVALHFGVLFFLFKYFEKKATDVVPMWNKNGSNGALNGHSHSVIPSKKLIFWKLWCYGMMVGIASKSWDVMVEQMEGIYEVDLKDPQLTVLQSQCLHSWYTWVLILFWRILQGQQLLNYLVIAIAVDKVWEFVNFVQYISYLIVGCVCLMSYLYIQYMKTLLKL